MNAVSFPSKKDSVREIILSILSEEFPLSTKEIYTRVKRQSAKSVTYQAVHKTIKQLVEKDTLLKVGTQYQISPSWMNQTRDYIRKMEHTYEEKLDPKVILSKLGKIPIELRFTNYTKMCVFAAELLVEYRRKIGKPTENYALIRNPWWPLQFDFSHFRTFIELDDGNTNNHIVLARKSKLGEWVANAYNMTGTIDKNRYGIPDEVKEDLIVRGDLVIEVQFSPQTQKALDKIYDKTKGLSDLFQQYIVKKEENFEITMMVSTDATKARLIKEKIKSYF